MAEIIWTEPAFSDLNDLAEFISLSNPSAAKKLVFEIFEAVERLEEFPLSGRLPLEIPDMDYREVVVPPCRVFYKLIEDKVYILFVLREERNLLRYISSFGLNEK